MSQQKPPAWISGGNASHVEVLRGVRREIGRQHDIPQVVHQQRLYALIVPMQLPSGSQFQPLAYPADEPRRRPSSLQFLIPFFIKAEAPRVLL